MLSNPTLTTKQQRNKTKIHGGANYQSSNNKTNLCIFRRINFIDNILSRPHVGQWRVLFYYLEIIYDRPVLFLFPNEKTVGHIQCKLLHSHLFHVLIKTLLFLPNKRIGISYKTTFVISLFHKAKQRREDLEQLRNTTN